MRSCRALALVITSLVIGWPMAGLAWTDPARGYDNPAPEPEIPAYVAPRVEAYLPLPQPAPLAPRAAYLPAPAPFVVLPPPMTPRPVPERPRIIEPSLPASSPSRPESRYEPISLTSSFEPVEVLPPEPAESYSGISAAQIAQALATDSTLDTPYTAQIDALESSRRAQRSARSYSTRPAFTIQAAMHDPAPSPIADDAFKTAYLLWAGTFFALAAMLSYVGWRVLRLVFGSSS